MTHVTTEEFPPNSNTNGNSNGSNLPFSHLSIMEVSDEADRLAKKFENKRYRRYYCKVIYWIGLERVHLIEARVSDSKYPERLFTKIANQEVALAKQKAQNHAKIEAFKDMKGAYGL